MKWHFLGLLTLGLALIGFGLSITQGRGSADERAGGALPVLLGVVIVALDLFFAFLWLVFRA